MSERSGVWACSICGPNEASTAGWCANGCGRDYKEMAFIANEPQEVDQ